MMCGPAGTLLCMAVLITTATDAATNTTATTAPTAPTTVDTTATPAAATEGPDGTGCSTALDPALKMRKGSADAQVTGGPDNDGRLGDGSSPKISGWCPPVATVSWHQMDLGSVQVVHGIVVQAKQSTAKFQDSLAVMYTPDASASAQWMRINQTFAGPPTDYTRQTLLFDVPVRAQILRVETKSAGCTKFGVVACPIPAAATQAKASTTAGGSVSSSATTLAATTGQNGGSKNDEDDATGPSAVNGTASTTADTFGPSATDAPAVPTVATTVVATTAVAADATTATSGVGTPVPNPSPQPTTAAAGSIAAGTTGAAATAIAEDTVGTTATVAAANTATAPGATTAQATAATAATTSNVTEATAVTSAAPTANTTAAANRTTTTNATTVGAKAVGTIAAPASSAPTAAPTTPDGKQGTEPTHCPAGTAYDISGLPRGSNGLWSTAWTEKNGNLYTSAGLIKCVPHEFVCGDGTTWSAEDEACVLVPIENTLKSLCGRASSESNVLCGEHTKWDDEEGCQVDGYGNLFKGMLAPYPMWVFYSMCGVASIIVLLLLTCLLKSCCCCCCPKSGIDDEFDNVPNYSRSSSYN